MIIETIHKTLETTVNYKNNIYSTGSSSLYIDIEEVVYKNKPCIWLHYILVAEFARSKGLASKTINTIINICKMYGYSIIGTPCQLESTSLTTEELTMWYKKFGFVENKELAVLELVVDSSIKELRDNLTLEEIKEKHSWLLKAQIQNAILGKNEEGILIWYDGVWENGVWVKGIWKNGIWKLGEWHDGIWEDGVWELGRYYQDIWKNKIINGLKHID